MSEMTVTKRQILFLWYLEWSQPEAGARGRRKWGLVYGVLCLVGTVSSSCVSLLLSPSLSYPHQQKPTIGKIQLHLPKAAFALHTVTIPAVTYVQCQISSHLALSPALVLFLTSKSSRQKYSTLFCFHNLSPDPLFLSSFPTHIQLFIFKSFLFLQLPFQSLLSFIIRYLAEQFLTVTSSWSSILYLLISLSSGFHLTTHQISFIKTHSGLFLKGPVVSDRFFVS